MAQPGKGHGAPLPYQVLRRDVIINADLWANKPEMMAAGLGFTTIIGVPNLSASNLALSKTMTLLAGGTWNTVHCAAGETPALSNYTSAAPLSGFRARTRGSPYTDPGVPPAQRGGPVLVAAKLSRMSTAGDTGPKIFQQNLPNDGVSLYGRRARFRLRVYTSGGMTPNGVSALLPTDYNRFFRVDAVTSSGKTIRLTRSGRTYTIDGHPLRVVGLADLGRKQARYGDCYTSDNDNYIDIILNGSLAAARRITTVEIPSTGQYAPLYNPGGPGSNPAPGVRYSAPSPPISQHVTIALRNPMTVTYRRHPHQPPGRQRSPSS